jgi:SAM-dependent methyltransferase
MGNPNHSIIRRWWWRQQFAPGPVGLLLNPFYFARLGLLDAMREFFPQLKGEVLDVGCGRKPYREFVSARRYVGVDLDTPEMRGLGEADYFYDGKRIPINDAEFDAVICSQVLEHVFKPSEFLQEIHRVLRPGGLLLLTTPFAWDEHEQPHDFARYSSFGLRHVLESSGFRIRAQRKTCANGSALVQLSSAYIYKLARSRSRLINHLVQMTLIAPINVVGGLFASVIPANPDFYLDNVVLAAKEDLISIAGSLD